MTHLLATTFNLLAQTAPAAGAPAAGAAKPQPGFDVTSLLPMVLFGAGFYFLLIRPQQKKAKEIAKKQSELKTGDKVATSSGIVGKVVSIDDTAKTVTLQVSEGVRIPFQRAAIVEFLSEEPVAAKA